MARWIPSSRWLQRLVLVAFGLALFASALALNEAVLAWVGAGDPDRFPDPFVGFEPGRPLFVRQVGEEGADRYVTSPEKLAFFNQQQFPAVKERGTYRIFALGGSTTFGSPYDAAVAFPRWLEIYLESTDPGRRWEVINAGGISYASYRIVVLMKELARHRPDLFIVYTGHNEFLEERTYSAILERPRAVKRAQVWLGGLRSYTLARTAWSGLTGDRSRPESTLAAEVEASLDGWTGIAGYRRTAEFKRATAEHFEDNLRRMVAVARSAGAELVFIKPISNLKDFSPFKTEHRKGLDRGSIARFAALVDDGRAALAAGDPSGAAAHLRRALDLDGEHAGAHYELGRALLAAGSPVAAREALVRAKDLDVAPLRALESFLVALERVSDEQEVELVDLPSLLEDDCERRLGHRILGNEYLLDHVHPDIAIHSRIGEVLLEWLVRGGVAQPGEGWIEEVRHRLYREVVGALDAVYYARRDLNLAKVLGWAGKLEEAEPPLERAAIVLVDDAEVHLNLGILRSRTGRRAEAEPALLRAAALAPDMPEVHFNLGVVYGETGRLEEGIAALRRALELRADYAEALYNLGVLLRRAGALEEAIRTLERAAAAKPHGAAVHRQLAAVYRLSGRVDEALAAHARSIELAPEDPAARTELAATLAGIGREQEAERSLREILAADPDHADAHFQLGSVLTRQARIEEAAAAYRRALECDAKHVKALVNLGILHGRAGELEAARAVLERAVEIAPAYAEAHYNLAIVLDAAGVPERSLSALRRAVELDPVQGRFHFALATVLDQRGEQALARRHYALARERGVVEADEALRRLEGESR
ncbi:MAG TPA: tetratricopeptide repeat protein [Thermoanaerobaculia bacterium]|nr:tetratricopeptide repeat protein [Thermoanaerobaculia bacterium]